MRFKTFRSETMRYENLKSKVSNLTVFCLISFCLTSQICCSQTGWQTVSSFGTNPGNLNMYSYAPTGITGN
ncbi:MAG TPA: hypothetical protein VF411_03995, partial [Bacteroidia bacterium]